LRAARDRLADAQARSIAARREADSRHAAAVAEASLAEERIGRLSADIAGRAETLAALTARRERLAGELAAAAATESDARTRLERMRATASSGRARLAEAERTAVAARERLRQAEDAARAAELVEMEARLAIDAVREAVLVELAALGELGLDRLRRALPSDHILPDTDDDAEAFEAAVAAISPRWSESPPADEPPSSGRLAALRRRYHELGAVNPFADREYAEIAERLTGLQTQEADLRAAIHATQRLIGEINTLIADQFRATFRALEAAFDRQFRQLFGGGFARLELTEPADLSVTGVEIIARPPGKKPQALAMLSGGERALTAVALLFAMLEVRPVPFCVLDEVDAALDEANIGRFTDALVELARGTQVIVITHNRGTIEVADALYGVTVGDDSVSRVVSLRLDEATAIAERQAERSRTAAAAGAEPVVS
jgi:chromosome segregation protein